MLLQVCLDRVAGFVQGVSVADIPALGHRDSRGMHYAGSTWRSHSPRALLGGDGANIGKVVTSGLNDRS